MGKNWIDSSPKKYSNKKEKNKWKLNSTLWVTKEIQTSEEVQTSAFMVVQWQRICLLVKETRVPSLVQEDPTFHGEKKPVRCNHWAYAPEPGNRNCCALGPRLLKPGILGPLLQEKPPPRKAHAPQLQSSPHLLRLERSSNSSKDPAQPINK